MLPSGGLVAPSPSLTHANFITYTTNQLPQQAATFMPGSNPNSIQQMFAYPQMTPIRQAMTSSTTPQYAAYQPIMYWYPSPPVSPQGTYYIQPPTSGSAAARLPGSAAVRLRSP